MYSTRYGVYKDGEDSLISIIFATFQVKKEKLFINITGKYGNIWSGLILPVDAGDRRVCLGLYTGC